MPNPIAPQTWHFRQSIEYSLTINYAILDMASKRKEDFLFNMYRMGRNAIEKGSRDSLDDASEADRGGAKEAARSRRHAGARGARPASRLQRACCATRQLRDPRGFILPSDQPDFLTATKFVNTLIKAGVVVHRATAPFTPWARSVSRPARTS